MEKTPVLPLTPESRFGFCSFAQPLSLLPSEGRTYHRQGWGAQKSTAATKDGSWSAQPCSKPAGCWVPGAWSNRGHKQLFADKWHLLMCWMLQPWSTLPEESSSAISDLIGHFAFPIASSSINGQLMAIALNPQEVKLRKATFRHMGQKHKPLLNSIHFNDLCAKHLRHFSTKHLRSPPPIPKAQGIVHSAETTSC